MARSRQWWIRFSVNSSKTWRTRAADALSRLATRLDGRMRVAVYIESDPPLDLSIQAGAIRVGLEHTERLLREMVELAAVDELVQTRHPEVFGKER